MTSVLNSAHFRGWYEHYKKESKLKLVLFFIGWGLLYGAGLALVGLGFGYAVVHTLQSALTWALIFFILGFLVPIFLVFYYPN
tara:strand:+ start:786 stop:1034 length:249 start_codon:yes stop_codon:yes gene_type:complete